MRTLTRRISKRDSRGAALVEFAIAVPIFIALVLLVFDAGLGYSASRNSSSAARSAARVGALAGDARDADYRVLDAVRSHYGGDDENVSRIVIYLSDPGNAGGLPPGACIASSVPGVCNSYPASILSVLTPELFASEEVAGEEVCAAGAPDFAWCPLNRRDNDGSFLGVYIASTADTATRLELDAFNLENRAVFRMFFPVEPEPLATPATGG